MNSAADIIVLHQPRLLVFGVDCPRRFVEDVVALGRKRIFIVTSPPTAPLADPVRANLSHSAEVRIWAGIDQEPTIQMFRAALDAAKDFGADAIVGLGGGSALDVAKLVAAFLGSSQEIGDTFGIGKLQGRSTYLACLPTTAGTGSEVSPNAILLDESEQLKRGVVSPHLVPDAAYVDPALTLTVPPAVTAATGIDALTHCIEAYANRLAHPMIDLYALEGIRLISRNLLRAVEHGTDIQARTAMALGSMYGGLCLGPVNTGAVHALAYPLGGEFHIPHGVSNSVLLPHVLEFNLPAAPDRYAAIALAMGVEPVADNLETARRGLELIGDLSRRCGIPSRMRDLGVPESAIERMARSAMTVTRLLDRNVRTVTEPDAIAIYRKAM